MRKICDSSRYFTRVRLTSSALDRSWPIGFSTTTCVKFGAGGGAAARLLDSFKFCFKFYKTVGRVEPRQVIETVGELRPACLVNFQPRIFDGPVVRAFPEIVERHLAP